MRSDKGCRGLVLRAGTLALALLLSGCAAPIERRADGVSGGSQGWSSDASFSGPDVVVAETWPEFSPELSRRDTVLGVQASASPYPLDVWPGEPLPRLERSRRVFINGSDRRVIFFERLPDRRR